MKRRLYEKYVLKREQNVTEVYIYIRVSTVDQAEEGYSLAAQEKKLKQYCADHKYKILGLYADRGISAKDISHRPDLLRLLKDIQDNPENKKRIVLVWKLSRFSRCLLDLVETCDRMEEYNTFLVSYTEPFDSSTPIGRFMRGILGLVAQFEREIISENVMLGMAERAEQGKRTCTNVLGYDLSGKDSLTFNEAEAEYVLFAARTYLERKNLSETARLCDERGYRGKRGKRPTPESIRVIISNPLYCGYNKFCGKFYKGTHPQLISIETHNKIIRTLKAQGQLSGRYRQHMLFYIDPRKDIISIPGHRI